MNYIRIEVSPCTSFLYRTNTATPFWCITRRDANDVASLSLELVSLGNQIQRVKIDLGPKGF